MPTLPPGGAQIGHQGALLEGKRCFFSAVCGPIWLILGWRVGVGHGYLATRFKLSRTLGTAIYNTYNKGSNVGGNEREHERNEGSVKQRDKRLCM